jgi:hypothetical protein
MSRTRRAPATETPNTSPTANPAPATTGGGGPASGVVMTGSAIERELTSSSGFGYISFFTVDGDACLVRLDLTVPSYRLAATAANYNAKVAALLAAWINRCRVSFEYSTFNVPIGGDDPPRTIVQVTALPDGSEG